MRIVILGSRGWHTDDLCRALTDRGHVSEVLPYEALARFDSETGSARLSANASVVLDADAVLPRMIPSGSLEQIIYRVDALHWIEARGVTVMNSPRAMPAQICSRSARPRVLRAYAPAMSTIPIRIDC